MIIKTRRRVVALCCECGQRRLTTVVTFAFGFGEISRQADYDRGIERCTVRRRCRQCWCIRTHAFLRSDNDPAADDLEVIAYTHHGSLRAYRLAVLADALKRRSVWEELDIPPSQLP